MNKLIFSLIVSVTYFTSYANPLKVNDSTETKENFKQTFWYNDGVVSIEKWYGADKKLDSLKTYHKSGQLDELFYYDKGIYNGKSYKFDQSGRKMVTWEFNQGYLTQRTDHFFPSNKNNEEKVQYLHDQLKKVNEEIKLNPNKFGLHYKRANLRHRLGNNILAIEDFLSIRRKLDRISKTEKVPNKFFGNLFDNIASIYASFEMEDYAVHYRYKALEVNPEQTRLAYNLGAYLFTIKYYDLAQVYLNKALKVWPNHPFSHRTLACLQTDLGNYDKAMEHINIAFPREKHLIELGALNNERGIRTIRGFLHHKLGDSQKGIIDLNEAIQLKNDNSFAHYSLGVIYHDLGEYDKACELLQKSKNLGYEKIHDRYDLQAYLDNSCQSKPAVVSNKPIVNITKKPSVYPNPVKNNVHVQNINFTDFIYSIYSFDNRLIQKGDSSINSPINISTFSSGLYIIKVTSDTGITHSFRVIKE